ncbi:MAG: thiamine phosphate synthase [Sedimenticola sp.]|nr:thiamine phosphate synthase [Sedimenticola sp.]
MSQKAILEGLYAITQAHPAGFDYTLKQVEAALSGGVRILQYRDKQPGEQRRITEAENLRTLCHQNGALLIINDDVDLAKRSHADGVHVGREDSDIANARNKLGKQAIIGISCYNQLPLARDAEKAGADYVAFGRFFPSRTKPEAVQAKPELLEEAKRQLRIPIVAIGGITPENGATLIQSGADMLAVIHAIFGTDDIAASCQRFNQLFDRSERVSS